MRRRNEKSIERQLVVLNNNLTTYQSDLRYVEEDIAETERRLETIELNMKRPGGESGRIHTGKLTVVPKRTAIITDDQVNKWLGTTKRETAVRPSPYICASLKLPVHHTMAA